MIFFRIPCAFGLMLCCGAGAGAEQSTQTVPAESEVDGLIARLGHDDFAEREAASNRLVQLGIATKPSLVEALSHPGAEIRYRARRALDVIVQADFKARLKAFGEDTHDAHDHGLAAWSKFRKAIGSDKAARALFVQMQEAEPALLVASDEGPTPAAKALASRLGPIEQARRRGLADATEQLGPAAVAAYLFVASDPEVVLTDASTEQLILLARDASFGSHMQESPLATASAKIVGQWIVRPVSVELAPHNLMLSVQLNVKDGFAPALQLLDEKDVPPRLRYVGLLVVGRFGGEEHLPLAAPFLDDDAYCLGKPAGKYHSMAQVRDVALAVTIRLQGKRPQDFGFHWAGIEKGVMSHNAYHLGFRTEAVRTAAFAKWEADAAIHRAKAAGDRKAQTAAQVKFNVAERSLRVAQLSANAVFQKHEEIMMRSGMR